MAEPTTRERAYRMRCYPNARQRLVRGRLFGASRFVWNWALARRTSAYQADQIGLNRVGLSREFTGVRQAPETHWLPELPREPFNQVLRVPDDAAPAGPWQTSEASSSMWHRQPIRTRRRDQRHP